MRFLHRTPDPFPRPKDVPNLPQADAERALEALRRMTVIDLASVHTGAGSHGSHGTRWYVWLDITGRRLTLAEWAAEWLKKHPTVKAGRKEGA